MSNIISIGVETRSSIEQTREGATEVAEEGENSVTSKRNTIPKGRKVEKTSIREEAVFSEATREAVMEERRLPCRNESANKSRMKNYHKRKQKAKERRGNIEASVSGAIGQTTENCMEQKKEAVSKGKRTRARLVEDVDNNTKVEEVRY